jgi:hypothetical protein
MKPQIDSYAGIRKVNSIFATDYSSSDRRLKSLYEKFVESQWSSQTQVDWNENLEYANPLSLRDPLAEIADQKFWGKFGKAEQEFITRELQNWKVSQILHTEQAAMIVCTVLSQVQRTLPAKLCSTMQATDEARHVETFQRLLNEKMGGVYKINTYLNTLLSQFMNERRESFLTVGMQIIVEGVGLALFRRLLAYSESPIIKQILRYVIKDEARHFALGQTILRDHELSREIECDLHIDDFVCESLFLLNEYLESTDVLVDAGVGKKEAETLLKSSRASIFTRHSLYRSVVPAIFDLGLARGSVLKILEEMDLLKYQSN